MATKYENYITGDDSRADIYGARWAAQTFTPDTNHIVTSVKLLLYRNNSPGTVTVSIRATSAGLPSGIDLASGTTTGNNLATADPYEWREITFSSGALVVAGTIYAIVVRATGGDSGNNLYWRYDGSDAGYTDGHSAFSTDSGSTWPHSLTDDYMFEEWGGPQGAGEGGVIYPTEAITRVTNLIHRYNRATGVYTLELALGEVTSDFGLPEWLTRPQPAVPKEPEKEVAVSPVTGEPLPTRWPPAPGEVPGPIACPICGVIVPYFELAEHMRTAHPPVRTPTYEEQRKYEEWFKKRMEELREMGWKG